MPAAITDYFGKYSNGSQPIPTTLSAQKLAGATTASLTTATGWDTTTVKHVRMYNTTVSGTQTIPDQSSICIYKATLSGTTLSNLTLVWSATGSDQTYAAGATVDLAVTPSYTDQLATGILTSLDQDGTLKAGAVDNVGVFASGVISTTAPFATSYNPETRTSESVFDYIVSGGVWSGDSYATTRNASMTALVCYINGQRGTISAVTARSFTASKDTYVDILNSSGTFSLVYTEVANNAASPALAANSIRLAIIVTGATNIASAGSVNQGEESKVLPIASSVPYAVTDSLGNLICPRDPQRKILGMRRVTANQSVSSVTATQITGLTCPVIVPTGRKVKITAYSPSAFNSVAGNVYLSIWDGVVASGTQLNEGISTIAGSNYISPITVEDVATPTSTSKTYNAGYHNVTGTAGTLASAGTVYIKVELA